MKFFLLDRVDQLTPNASARGIKNLTLSEDIFFDHFPGHPTYPGTLMLEAMAQLAGLLAEASYHAQYPDTRRAVLMQVEDAKFREPAVPGDQLQIDAQLNSLISAAAQIETHVMVGTREIAQARLMFRLVTVATPQVHEQRRMLYELWTRHLDPRPVLR